MSKYTCPMHSDVTRDHPGNCPKCHMKLVRTNNKSSLNKMAISATLHCLTGCAIGEVLGLIVGTALGWGNIETVILATALAFVFGFGLSALPLVQAGLGFFAALSIVAVADTLSIATMEIVDNLVMLIIPGAMDARLIDPLFWLSMALALTVAYFVALPVNRHLLAKGRGHALTMKHHKNHNHGISPLLFSLIGFFVGGLLVSLAISLYK
jgi:hypothetical protein